MAWARLHDADDVKLQCGLRLRAAREHLGLGQEVLARELGTTRSALSNWEGGDRLADVLAMTRLYRRFGIPLEWIFAGDLKNMPYDMAQDIESRAGQLGAVVGGTVAEWPHEVERRPGLAGLATPARAPKPPRGRRTLHEPKPDME